MLALPLLLIIFLAQANDFVTFEICRVDYMATPWEARHAGEEPFSFRPSAITAIQELPQSVVGLRCSKICSARHCVFVIGTEQDVREALR